MVSRKVALSSSIHALSGIFITILSGKRRFVDAPERNRYDLVNTDGRDEVRKKEGFRCLESKGVGETLPPIPQVHLTERRGWPPDIGRLSEKTEWNRDSRLCPNEATLFMSGKGCDHDPSLR